MFAFYFSSGHKIDSNIAEFNPNTQNPKTQARRCVIIADAVHIGV